MAEKTGVSEAGPSRPRANGRTAVDTAVARLADDARPPRTAEHSATTNSDIAVSAGEAGPSWSRASGMNSAAATAAVKSAGEARPPRIAKYGAKKESELAVLEELSEWFERMFGYTVEFPERIFKALN